MHPFPPTKDLQFLLEGDATLIHIGMGSHQTAFAFQNRCVVQAELSFSHIELNGVETRYEEDLSLEPRVTFHSLLGKMLSAYVVEGLTLRLSFDDGQSLVIHSDLGPYEAGNISGPTGQFIVF